MTDTEILNSLEQRCEHDFVYYDNVCARTSSPDNFARRTYAREILEFIRDRRQKGHVLRRQK